MEFLPYSFSTHPGNYPLMHTVLLVSILQSTLQQSVQLTHSFKEKLKTMHHKDCLYTLLQTESLSRDPKKQFKNTKYYHKLHYHKKC